MNSPNISMSSGMGDRALPRTSAQTSPGPSSTQFYSPPRFPTSGTQDPNVGSQTSGDPPPRPPSPLPRLRNRIQDSTSQWRTSDPQFYTPSSSPTLETQGPSGGSQTSVALPLSHPLSPLPRLWNQDQNPTVQCGTSDSQFYTPPSSPALETQDPNVGSQTSGEILSSRPPSPLPRLWSQIQNSTPQWRISDLQFYTPPSSPTLETQDIDVNSQTSGNHPPPPPLSPLPRLWNQNQDSTPRWRTSDIQFYTPSSSPTLETQGPDVGSRASGDLPLSRPLSPFPRLWDQNQKSTSQWGASDLQFYTPPSSPTLETQDPSVGSQTSKNILSSRPPSPLPRLRDRIQNSTLQWGASDSQFYTPPSSPTLETQGLNSISQWGTSDPQFYTPPSSPTPGTRELNKGGQSSGSRLSLPPLSPLPQLQDQSSTSRWSTPDPQSYTLSPFLTSETQYSNVDGQTSGSRVSSPPPQLLPQLQNQYPTSRRNSAAIYMDASHPTYSAINDAQPDSGRNSGPSSDPNHDPTSTPNDHGGGPTSIRARTQTQAPARFIPPPTGNGRHDSRVLDPNGPTLDKHTKRRSDYFSQRH